MRKLPELEFLNSLPVDRDALEDSNLAPQVRDPLQAVQLEAQKSIGEKVEEFPSAEEDSVDYGVEAQENQAIVQSASKERLDDALS